MKETVLWTKLPSFLAATNRGKYQSLSEKAAWIWIVKLCMGAWYLLPL